MKLLALILSAAASHAAPAPKPAPKVDPRCAEWNAVAYSKDPKIKPGTKQTAIKNLELYQCPLTFNKPKLKPAPAKPAPQPAKN